MPALNRDRAPYPFQKVAERRHSDRASPGGALGAGAGVLPGVTGVGAPEEHPARRRRRLLVGCAAPAQLPVRGAVESVA